MGTLSALDQIKHATCVAKFDQFMCLVLLGILQQSSATSSRVGSLESLFRKTCSINVINVKVETMMSGNTKVF